MVVFREIPNEITLAINITNCPCKCRGCHSKFLWADTGTELTYECIKTLIDENTGITCVCFMGGDSDQEYVNDMGRFIKGNYEHIKTAWYSGMETLSNKINLKNFDYIKIGPYIEEYGGLDCETTNQRMYKVVDGEMVDITAKMKPKRF